MSARIEWDEMEYGRFRDGVAAGIFNACGAIEGSAKAYCPVRTGNLRRSIHSVVYIDGRRQYGGADENGKGVPDYPTGSGVEGFVGTNTEYGVYVHNGTVKMAGRPFLWRSMNDNRGRVPEYFAAGFRAKFG
jgi:HK97 gp10 family phage protein